MLLTCQQETGDSHSIQLLGGGDVVLVHEVVQKVDGQVPGRGAEMAVSAQQGENVYKEPTALQERGVGTKGGQLQFLEDSEQRKVKDMETRGLPACLPVDWRGGQRFPLHPCLFV